MNTKKEILTRIYIVYTVLLLLGGLIIWKIIDIQFIGAKYWKTLEKKLHYSKKKKDSERGTIYSADMNILSASLPFYDLYLDFKVDYLRTGNGISFKENIDSLAFCLAELFQDKTATEYKQNLQKIYTDGKVICFKKDLTYEQKKIIQTFPLVRKGRYISGFRFVEKNKRKYPYGILAKRTIGFVRDTLIYNVGLESTYNHLLRGESGYQPIHYIGGGVYAPIDGYNIKPNNGKDLITTIDTRIQDITENALLKMLKNNQAEWGTAVVMEVSTGKIKAIANLGINEEDSVSYFEKINYALRTLEPGSTFKIVTLLTLLEDKLITLEDEINLFGGTFEYAKNAVMKDSEKHNLKKTTVKKAFAQSSNVGISWLSYKYYQKKPHKFFSYFKKLHLNERTGIDLIGELNPYYKTPNDKKWTTQTSLPWTSIGYELSITPMRILTLYNAIANNGKMMVPYLVSDIYDEGKRIKHFPPKVVEEKICSNTTLANLKELLLAVTTEGTGRHLFNNTHYKVCGKTGTSLFYGPNGYKDSIYQASFVGFFPLENPIYTCIVFIKNKSKAKNYYGAGVAGPVFKEIADKLYALYNVNNSLKNVNLKKHSHTPKNELKNENFFSLTQYDTKNKNFIMPDLKDKSISDIIKFTEKNNIAFITNGKGDKIISQNIQPGSIIHKKDIIKINLQ